MKITKLFSVVFAILLYLPAVLAVGEDGVSLSISAYFFMVALGFLIAPIFIKDFSKWPMVNFVFRRGMVVIGVYLMMLNAGVMLTLANFAGITIGSEFASIITILSIVGYLLIISIFLTMFIDMKDYLQQKKHKKRMGEDD